MKKLILVILLIIIAFFSVIYTEKHQEKVFLQKSLELVSEYYKYYNAQDYDKLSLLLAPMSNKDSEYKRLLRIKNTRELTGKYISMQYPDNEFKNRTNLLKNAGLLREYSENASAYPDKIRTKRIKTATEQVRIERSKLSEKYGENIFEDEVCYKNSYEYDKNAIFICVKAKYENGAQVNYFAIDKMDNNYKIVVPPFV